MSGVIRDFSQEAIANIRELIKENVDEEKQFFLWDWVDDTFKMDDLNIQDYLNDVTKYQKHMADKHNINTKKFERIVERVQGVDINYAKRFNTIYESMVSYNNKILKVTRMISPEGITLNTDIYDSVITGVERLHNSGIDYLKYDLEKYDNELPQLREIQWYEKALNAVGGTAVSLVRDNIEGLCFIPYAIADGLFGTDLNYRLNNVLDDAEEYLVKNVVSDKEYYYYGKTVGNAVCMVEGIVFIATGVTTIAGGITLLGGGTVLSSTGIGAIIGGLVIAVSVPVVAAGALQTSFGAGVFYSSMDNLKDNISKAKESKNSKVDKNKLNDDIKELDGKVDNKSNKLISEFIRGDTSFDSVLDEYAKLYSEKVNSNIDWSWNKSIEGGEKLTIKQKKLIKQMAIDKGYIPNVKITKVEGLRYGFADFNSSGVVKETVLLPESMWKLSDAEQFKWLDKKIGAHVDGYTWHHTQIPGKMELVPTGIHNITTHNGGRTMGMWADAPR